MWQGVLSPDRPEHFIRLWAAIHDPSGTINISVSLMYCGIVLCIQPVDYLLSICTDDKAIVIQWSWNRYYDIFLQEPCAFGLIKQAPISSCMALTISLLIQTILMRRFHALAYDLKIHGSVQRRIPYLLRALSFVWIVTLVHLIFSFYPFALNILLDLRD